MIQAITLLLMCQLAGEVVTRALGLAVPGPVLGMLLLLLLLAVFKSLPGRLHRTSGAILANLSLMFVPAGVGVMQHVSRIQDEWLAIGVALVASTLATMAVVAVTFRLTARLMAGRALDRGQKSGP